MNWAVVMAGGPGTRFWPESRAKHPKPFLRLLGNRTLLEETVARLHPLFPPARILVVLQEKLVREARRLLSHLPPENILGEPMSRNTAPCAVYAASQIAARDPEACLVFLPADQHIRPKSAFLRSLKRALEIADDQPVLMGIPPSFPTSAYGYLEVQKQKKKQKKGTGTILGDRHHFRGLSPFSDFSVLRFHEKPTPAKAREFLKKGNFLWNGGTFAWRLEAFKKSIRTHLPRLYPAFDQLASLRVGTRAQASRLSRLYQTFPSVSLDYGLLEKMRNVHGLLAPFQWNDLGGWPGLAEFWPEDNAGNRIGTQRATPRRLNRPILIRSRGNLVKINERLVALLGVQNLLVIDTPDALLICPRTETEQIREVVRELEKRKAFKYL